MRFSKMSFQRVPYFWNFLILTKLLQFLLAVFARFSQSYFFIIDYSRRFFANAKASKDKFLDGFFRNEPKNLIHSVSINPNFFENDFENNHWENFGYTILGYTSLHLPIFCFEYNSFVIKMSEVQATLLLKKQLGGKSYKNYL